MERRGMDKRMKSVFVVYNLDNELTEAVFSIRSDADAWIARQEKPPYYVIKELPIDLCVDGYDVYAITYDIEDNTWTNFKSNARFEHPPFYYEGEDWWSVYVKAKSKDEALEKAKELINKAIKEL